MVRFPARVRPPRMMLSTSSPTSVVRRKKKVRGRGRESGKLSRGKSRRARVGTPFLLRLDNSRCRILYTRVVGRFSFVVQRATRARGRNLGRDFFFNRKTTSRCCLRAGNGFSRANSTLRQAARRTTQRDRERNDLCTYL